MVTGGLDFTRKQILAYRRRVGALDERLPAGAGFLREAAWAGLQDSMPRAALLSIHARVAGTQPDTWEDPSLVQLWGPRYSTYVVAAEDLPVFSLGRRPDDPKKRQRAEEVASALHGLLDGARMTDRDAGTALGISPNMLRYAAPTGAVQIRWDGARAPVVWTVPAPDVDPRDARRELARRHLHVFGPTTPGSFAVWAGIGAGAGAKAFDDLHDELASVRTPMGDAWILASDEAEVRADPAPPAPARLLPSGDAYFLLQGNDRALLVPEAARRAALWPSRVWPGALLVDGEIVGTWRRKEHVVTAQPWQKLTRAARAAVEAEAEALPLPGITEPVKVRWDA